MGAGPRRFAPFLAIAQHLAAKVEKLCFWGTAVALTT
jgi:hypothetical protein